MAASALLQHPERLHRSDVMPAKAGIQYSGRRRSKRRTTFHLGAYWITRFRG
jgi:hypothetical protein